MTHRRDIRSIQIPAIEPSTTLGTIPARLSRAISAGPALSCWTAMNGKAVEVISDPKIEIIDAEIRSRNECSVQTPR